MAANSRSETLKLDTPDAFPAFPYQPYEIQLELMRHVYASIEARKAAVVESPTGTGKSLSLICSSLTWLQDNAARARKAKCVALSEAATNTGSQIPRWMLEQDIERTISEMEADEVELQQRIQAIRDAKEQRIKDAKARGVYSRKRQASSELRLLYARADDQDEQKLENASNDEITKDDEQFAPDAMFDAGDGLTPTVREMMKAYDGRKRPKWGAADSEEPDTCKILFTSRTHSQLSQFLDEVRKTEFAKSVRVVALGGRQNLCINDKVRDACRSAETLNDKCLDMQKAEKGKRCEFLPQPEDDNRLDDFRDRTFADVYSIDDLEDLGREMKVCPYYGSRRAVRQAQLVTLPYNLLLLKQARESLGISLDENVVVIDEAHNLIDTILSIHSVEITSTSLSFAKGALLLYLKRFKARLKGSNAVYLKQLVGFMSALDSFCKDWLASKKTDQMLKAVDVLLACAVDQTNLRALDKYLTESKIAQKVSGYMDNLEAKDNTNGSRSRAAKIASIHRIQTFLLSLANSEKDGRVLVTTNGDILCLKYQLLNPADSFADFAAARSVVIAGGTMAPLSDFSQQLLNYSSASAITNLSCAHVVPFNHILAKAISSGPSGYKLEFKYAQRNDTKMLDEYGAVLTNVISIVPRGVVVFVPSYASLEIFLQRWQQTGLIQKLENKKKVFVEPKDGAQTENVLTDYSKANADGSHGGILFAVVGAKLSEGINFQDDLCRCVVIIGIPYPSSQSTELKERMRYVASLPAVDGLPSGDVASKRLYSNLAFRAVNQSIGRSIRHIHDWSSILLLDARYCQSATQDKLPKWISNSLSCESNFGSLVKSLAGFMQERRRRAAVT